MICLTEYQQSVKRFAFPTPEGLDVRFHWALKIPAEVIELSVAEYYDATISEIGDVLYYLAMFSNSMNWDLCLDLDFLHDIASKEDIRKQIVSEAGLFCQHFVCFMGYRPDKPISEPVLSEHIGKLLVMCLMIARPFLAGDYEEMLEQLTKHNLAKLEKRYGEIYAA